MFRDNLTCLDVLVPVPASNSILKTKEKNANFDNSCGHPTCPRISWNLYNKPISSTQISIAPVSSSGAGARPNTLVELRVSGDAGAYVALLAEDTNAIQAGLANQNGLGNGLDMHIVSNFNNNIVLSFTDTYFTHFL